MVLGKRARNEEKEGCAGEGGEGGQGSSERAEVEKDAIRCLVSRLVAAPCNCDAGLGFRLARTVPRLVGIQTKD